MKTKETHTDGLRGAGRAHRGAPQLRVRGVGRGSLLITPVLPQECTGNPPSLPSRGPQCPRERT